MNEQELFDLLQFASKFSETKEKERQKLPFHLNLIDQLHINENAHSRILMHLLSYMNGERKYVFLTSLIDLIKWGKQKGDYGSINVVSPSISQEKERIDLWVRDNSFAIIFENKIYNAADKEAQLSRYIEKTIKHGYNEQQIFVVYLSQYPKEPELQSWGKYKESFRSRYVNLSFCYDILPWLRNKVLPNIKGKEPFLQTAIIQYIDYLEGLFKKREIDKTMNMKLNELIEQHFNVAGQSETEKIQNIQKSAQELDSLTSQMKTLLETYRQNIFERWREQTSKQYPEFRPNKKHEAKRWFITDVTIKNIDEKQISVYIGADYIEGNSVIFYCGIFYDHDSTDEIQRLQESVVDKLGLKLPHTNKIAQQIFNSFDNGVYRDDYNVVYKFFCNIVDNIKSLSERPALNT